ncbi:MAG: hypothetical protein ABIW50_03630 [Candidatus Limnocylindria bacterium]
MSDVHDRFDTWLAADGAAELSRDVALHSSGCDRCLGQAAAIDGLLRLDVGAATSPPILDTARDGSVHTGLIEPRKVAWIAAAGVLALVTAIGVGNLGLARTGPAGAGQSRTPINEGVLGGAGGPSANPHTPSAPTDAVSASPVSSESEPAASIGPSIATARPTAAPTSAPALQPTTAPSATPDPTRTAEPKPSPSQTAAPTPSPTISPPPTPTPTLEPTPTPVPNCEDGIDNDDDLLIDGADPGCVLANDEFAA